MEEKEIMYFKDEDGNKIEMEVSARIYLEENEYLILSDPEDDSDDGDGYIFRVDTVDGSQEFNLVEEDKEFNAVKKEYKKLLYNK